MRAHLLATAAVAVLPALAAAQSKELPLKHAPQPTSAAISAGDLMTRLYIFADDSMQGRETGTAAHLRATNYIANELKKLGLKPAGDNGTWFQDVPVIRRALDSSSTIAADGVMLAAGKDFIATGRGNVKTSFSGQVVYGGVSGDTTSPIPAAQLQGRIVLLRAAQGGRGGRGGRGGFGGFGAQNVPGAAAVLVVEDALQPLQVRNALHPREGDVQLLPQSTDAPAAPTITISREAADALLGAPLASAQKGQTGKEARVNLKFVDTPAPARNVIAIYEGRDPKLKGEYVAIGAHNDHIGIRQGPPVDSDSLHAYNRAAYPIREQWGKYLADNHLPRFTPMSAELQAKLEAIHVNMDSIRKIHPVPRLDSISNGADDDGSGSVTVLEVAEKFAKDKPNTKRSILFVWHVGEEKGLWGSRYVTDHPPVSRDSIVAQLNMDMVGRGAAGDLVEGGPNYLQLVGSHRLSTELGDMVEALNKKQATPFVFDYQFDAAGHPENIYCRSDHANYARFGIPVVFATTGLHGDYHQVTDEPQYIDYPHMAKIGNFMYDLANAVADLDHRVVVDHPKPDPNARCQQ